MAGVLKEIWADLLGKEISEIQDELNFFKAGGDSVAAIKLASKANSSKLTINVQNIFQHPTFGELKGMVEGLSDEQSSNDESHPDTIANSRSGGGKRTSKFKAYKIVSDCLAQCGVDGALLEDVLPCTPFQKELMRASHELGCWTFQAVFEISANAVDRAKQVLNDLHERNPVFRTRVAQHGTELYQLVFKSPVEWDTSEESLEVFKMKQLGRRMTYGERLSRCAVVHDTGRRSTFIVWTQTHAIYDRWSKMHVLDDIQEGFKDPQAFRSSPPRAPFGRFAEFVESQDRERSIEYWRRQLEGLRSYDFLAKELPIQQFKTSETRALRRTTKYLKPENTNITFATVAHAAWSMVLAKESRRSDILFCSFRSCRQMNLPGIDTMIGPLWSMVPVRTAFNTEHSIDELLQLMHQNMVDGIPHEPYGITALDEHFGHKGYLQSVLLPQPPQPDTFEMNVELKDERMGDVVKLRSAEELWTQTQGHFGLYIMLTPKGDDLELWARFDENFIDQNRVARLLDDYIAMMDKLFTVSWQETKVSDCLPDLQPSENVGEALSKEVDGQENEEYELEDILEGKPATLTYLLNPSFGDNLACSIPTKDKKADVSYRDLESHVRSFQQALAELGIKHESAVSMSLGNTYELIVAFLGTTRQRAIAAPLNPGYKQDEFEFYIDDLSTSLLLIPRGQFSEEEPAVAAARKYNAAIAEVYFETNSGNVVLDVKEKGKLEHAADDSILQAEEDDIALVLHTSGTTGRPKAVPLTHLNLMTNVANICITYRLRPRDRTLLIMPLFHVHGLLASFLSPLRSGGGAIIPERLTPEFWDQFKDSKATWYSATPTMHRMILQFPVPESGLPNIRFIRSCSSQLAPALFEQLQEKFKAPVLESYAMTEASHMMTSNPLPPGKRYPGSVGVPQNLDLKILDEEGKEVRNGKEGEVSIRGKNVTKGYLNNDEATKSSFTEEGFFRTGDQGKINEEGYLVLTGRLKELINKGGEKISPVELDNVINQHKDISECVSFAMDDEDYGQEVGCAIKLKDGVEGLDVKSLTKWIGEKLSAHKIPKKIWFPSEIPKTATGKVQRKMVAERMSKEEPAH